MIEQIILTKELKVLLISVLKSGNITYLQALEITKPFKMLEKPLSIAEARELMRQLEEEI